MPDLRILIEHRADIRLFQPAGALAFVGHTGTALAAHRIGYPGQVGVIFAYPTGA